MSVWSGMRRTAIKRTPWPRHPLPKGTALVPRSWGGKLDWLNGLGIGVFQVWLGGPLPEVAA